MADTKGGGSAAAPGAAADEPDGQGSAERTNGSRLADEQGRKGPKGKGRKRGGGRHDDGRKASGKSGKQKQRKRRKQGQGRGSGLELRPLAVLSALGGIAAGLVVGFVSGRSSGRH